MYCITRYTLTATLLCALSNLSIAQGLGTPVALSANSGGTQSPLDRWGRPSPDSRAWSDPALNHNKMLIGEGKYLLIGPYKVKGSPYLLGQQHSGDIFSAAEKAWNISLSYNTHNQEVEFFSTSNPGQPLVKEPGTLDSFILHANPAAGIAGPLKFIYGSILGTDDKAYFLEIFTGKRYSVYKKYRSELGYDTDNYGQSELRIFELQYDYFYKDNETKGIKKLKKNSVQVIKEFSSIKDLSVILTPEGFTAYPDEALRKAFEYLNN